MRVHARSPEFKGHCVRACKGVGLQLKGLTLSLPAVRLHLFSLPFLGAAATSLVRLGDRHRNHVLRSAMTLRWYCGQDRSNTLPTGVRASFGNVRSIWISVSINQLCSGTSEAYCFSVSFNRLCSVTPR